MVVQCYLIQDIYRTEGNITYIIQYMIEGNDAEGETPNPNCTVG